MIEWYPEIKSLHVAAAVTSGLLFAVRGLAVQLGRGRPMAAPLRYLSYSIDTVLLTAGLLLLAVLPRGMFADGWLTEKLLLVLAYIVLGSYALKRGRTPRARRICYMAALVTFAGIVAVARAHRPLGLPAVRRTVSDSQWRSLVRHGAFAGHDLSGRL
jgi:uncharacterized membrane protein SirB2